VSGVREAAPSRPVVVPQADTAPPRHPDRLVPLEDLIDERSRELVRRRLAGRGRKRRYVRVRLAVADVVALVSSFCLAAALVAPVPEYENRIGLVTELLVVVAALPFWLLLFRLYGLYDRDEERADHSTVDDVTGVFTAVTVGTALFFAIAYVTGAAHPSVPRLIAFAVAAGALVPLARSAARFHVRRSAMYVQNAVIVGAGDVGQLIGSKLLRHPEYAINLLGFVDKQPKRRRDDLAALAMLGGIAELPRIVTELCVDRVIVAFSGQDQGRLLEDLRPLRGQDVQVDVVPRFFDIVGPGAQFHSVEGLPLIGLPPVRLARRSVIVKRCLDIGVSAVGLVLLAPLLAVIAIAIRLDTPGPVFFRSARPGRGGRPISVQKFRTMRADAPAALARLLDEDASLRDQFESDFKLRADPRITRVGRRLRRTSLDELPQLWNVLTGHMSLVGPRPMLFDEVRRRGPSALELLQMKPGLTGYWQINGRSDVDYEDRIRLERAYIGSWSLALDLRILGKTVSAVCKGAGAR